MSVILNVTQADPSFTGSGGGVYGFIDWDDVTSYLRERNLIREGESVAGFRITDHGIHFEIIKN